MTMTGNVVTGQGVWPVIVVWPIMSADSGGSCGNPSRHSVACVDQGQILWELVEAKLPHIRLSFPHISLTSVLRSHKIFTAPTYIFVIKLTILECSHNAYLSHVQRNSSINFTVVHKNALKSTILALPHRISPISFSEGHTVPLY